MWGLRFKVALGILSPPPRPWKVALSRETCASPTRRPPGEGSWRAAADVPLSLGPLAQLLVGWFQWFQLCVQPCSTLLHSIAGHRFEALRMVETRVLSGLV